MSRFIHKSHNVSAAKYRRVVLKEEVEAVLREVCLEIALRFKIEFFEIGTGRPLGREIVLIFSFRVCPLTVQPKA